MSLLMARLAAYLCLLNSTVSFPIMLDEIEKYRASSLTLINTESLQIFQGPRFSFEDSPLQIKSLILWRFNHFCYARRYSHDPVLTYWQDA